MIAKETTLHKKPNNIEINNYRSLYGLQQQANFLVNHGKNPYL